jgi:hypothetical protein
MKDLQVKFNINKIMDTIEISQSMYEGNLNN